MSAALDVAGLTKIFANTGDSIAGGVRDASFALPAGGFFTLLGPSGCGKTTTLRCIAGLERPDRGSIRLDDTVFFDAAAGIDLPLNRRGIGMVFQSYAIWPHMTVFENVAFPLRVAKDRRFDREEIAALVGRALATVDLDGFQQRPATRLSGGQQQRVALARAIVRAPKLLLLDEPLSNLDAALREEMRRELKRLQQQIGVTTAYVTHDQAEALEMSDAIAVLHQGRIVQQGTPREIYFRPANGFVAGFVGATNLLHGRAVAAVAPGALGAVALGDGLVLRCLFPAGMAAGAAAVVSVRPEAIVFSRPGAPPGAEANRMAGRVVSRSFLGNLHRYRVAAGGQAMQVNTAPDLVLDDAAEVVLEFAVEAAVAVPP